MAEILGTASSTITRREALSLAWLACVGITASQAVGVAYSAMSWTDSTDVPNKRLLPVDLGYQSQWPRSGDDPATMGGLWFKVRLVPVDGGLIALSPRCPNRSCIVGWKRDQQRFICPCCGSMYTKTGAWIQGAAERGLDRVVLRAYDGEGRIVAQTDEQGAPLPILAGVRLEADPAHIIRGASRPWR